MNDFDLTGPVDYLVVEFPDNGMTGAGLPLLVDLVDRGVIRILDLVFVRKTRAGVVERMSLAELVDDRSPDLAVFEGAASGLVAPADVDDVGVVLEPGTVAALVVYVNSCAVPLRVALHQGGAQLVASARVPAQRLLAALDVVDPRPALN